ncbi:hypothetical protein DPMN_073416, partial [Dreissena polymorpha]
TLAWITNTLRKPASNAPRNTLTCYLKVKRKGDVDGHGALDVLDKVIDLARAVQRQLSQLTSGIVVAAETREDERAIKNTFRPVSHPIFETRCKILVGCNNCVNTWCKSLPPAGCPKCNGRTAHDLPCQGFMRECMSSESYNVIMQ